LYKRGLKAPRSQQKKEDLKPQEKNKIKLAINYNNYGEGNPNNIILFIKIIFNSIEVGF